MAAAHYLLEKGIEVELLESGERLGGTLGSERVEGFVFERGAHGFLDNVPETLDLAQELGLGARLLPNADAARKRYVLRRGRLVALGPRALLGSSLLSFRARLRLLSEPWRRAPSATESEDGDESVASFGRRRLGDAATKMLLDPVVTGVYAGDMERISLRSAFPRIAAMEAEHGSLFRGFRALKKTGKRSRLHSFPDGLQELVDALEARLGHRVRTGTTVSSLTREGDAYRLDCSDGTDRVVASVVLALPAPRAAVVVGGLDAELARGLEALPYAPVAVVCLGYRREQVEHPLDGFGYLVPRVEGGRILGAIWASSVFPPHAPPDKVSLRCLLGGAHDPDLVGESADELQSLATRELGPVLGLQGDPLIRRVYRYTKGIPQYNLGHARRIERIDAGLGNFPGLFLSGNAFLGVGVNDCVRQARRVAGKVENFLRASA